MSQNRSHAVMAQRAEPHEEWRAAVDWPGYEVSSLGRVRSWKWPSKGRQWIEDRNRPPRLLRPEIRNGYPSVIFSDCTKGRVHISVHVLVLETFSGERPHGMQVAHSDGDRTNNRLTNLRWATPVENNADKVFHGTQQTGAMVGSAKLTAPEVESIRARRAAGEKVRALAAEYGVCRNTITNITTGRYWREVSHAA